MKIILYSILALVATGMVVLRVTVIGWYLILFMGLIDLAFFGLHLFAGHKLIARTGGQFSATDWLAFGLMNGLYVLFFVCQGDGGDTGGLTTVWEKMTGQNAFTNYLYESGRWVQFTIGSGLLLAVVYGWVLFFRK